MWIVKWILWVIVLLFLISFGAYNSNQIVHIEYYHWRSVDLQLWIVMFLSFGFGMLVWLFGSIFKILQFKTEIRKLNRENSTLRKELDSLRNISIEEESSDLGEFEGEIS